MVENEKSVSAVIAERIKTGSKKNERKDPFKVGLVIEGGCMRGVVSGGMATALQALNAVHAFDAIYSASSGSCAGAYLLSGQTPEGTSIYYEDINNRKFIDASRLLKGKPIVDIQYLIYEVMKKVKPLDWKKVGDSEIPLHIYVTSATDATSVDLSKFETQEEILDALHWTCRMPVYAGMPLRVGETYYVDGGALNGGIMVDEALADGCTHVLVLFTRPKEAIKRDSFFERIAAYRLHKDFPELADALANSVSRNVDALKKIYDIEESPARYKQRVESISPPSGSHVISRTEKKRATLLRGAREGFNAVIDKFSQYKLPLDTKVQIKQQGDGNRSLNPRE